MTKMIMHRTMPLKHQPTKVINPAKILLNEDLALVRRSLVCIVARLYLALEARTLVLSTKRLQVRCARESLLKLYRAPIGKVYRVKKMVI